MDKLLDLIKRSGLIEADRLEKFLEKAAEQSGGVVPQGDKEFAQLFIDEGLLTQWQADKLLAGKHRGFMLGKYKLLGQIGKGGMSAVYLAEHIMMRRRVAIKVLPKNRVADKSYLERFQLEARAVAKLDDPNIVRAYDIDNEGDTHYIVMEYVEGRDLHQIVAQDGQLPFETAADYIAQVAGGLEHAHQMGLVHRDIKPANCLVDNHGTVKLLDMGLAKVTGDEGSLTLANEETVLGTADYLAPEQAVNSHEADARSDIYSLGCTFYFLLVGKPPFPEGTITERLLKHQTEEPEGILSRRPDCPLSLVDLIKRMMSKKAFNRPATSGEVASELKKWLSERGRSVGGATVRDDEPGVGSGILGRFSAPSSHGASSGGSSKIGPAGSQGSSAGSGSMTGDRDTKRLDGSGADTLDEDIGLAPIEDEELNKPGKKPAPASSPSKGPSPSKTKSSPSSGVLGDSRPSLTDKPGGDSSKAGQSGPPRSIFEEVYHEEEDDPIARRAARASEYDPLHPPGYVNPYNRTPAWVWVLAGVAAVVVIGLFIAMNN
ncbi:Serine/threonine-protein kinase PrkC [Pseudobythopirellula maris]|uniref:Serine/threonine-protein kinase PrkC n=1 Tax=Pseudobythopirellula maris TaxID=2527991 RepID=A0A5C5ZUA9_9BACT|nr:serine/threonine-protein kinase [Pseudobythopirellula maris]TWT90608.1 Serine/threonine-protein kinase PrkC [Pseudobythopirellula maris]